MWKADRQPVEMAAAIDLLASQALVAFSFYQSFLCTLYS